MRNDINFVVPLQANWTWPAMEALSCVEKPPSGAAPLLVKLKLNLEGAAAEAQGMGLNSSGDCRAQMQHGKQVRQTRTQSQHTYH